jgi:F-type H+-transporting ATPase subunit delta
VSTQARPQDYAQAIYDLAVETWSRQLAGVQQALKKDAPLRVSVGEPGLSTREKLDALSSALPGGLDAQVRKFLGTLLEAGHLEQLDAIVAEFDRLVRRREERKLALVTTAVPLTGSEREELQSKLLERFGPDLEFQYEVDASIIGGVRLQVGDKVIDGSVAGKLAALREQLAA